jgi:hypothetical protein
VSRILIFDVEHGFCAFVKSPTGHTLMIDCGKGHDFSPVQHIITNELSDAVSYWNFPLTRLIVTHPHDDHIEDVASVIRILPPYLLTRQTYNWELVKTTAGEGEHENLDRYAEWQQTYNAYVPIPDFGMRIQTFMLTPNEAYQLDRSAYVNNSGIVTVVTIAAANREWKTVFGADVEAVGWCELLNKPGFKQAVANADFYVASHHGHTSGFSSGLFDAMGKPFLNLVSVTDCDEHVDTRYSSPDFARGVEFGTGTRYMLTTRTDGTISIDIGADGQCVVTPVSLAPNLLKMAFRR